MIGIDWSSFDFDYIYLIDDAARWKIENTLLFRRFGQTLIHRNNNRKPHWNGCVHKSFASIRRSANLFTLNRIKIDSIVFFYLFFAGMFFAFLWSRRCSLCMCASRFYLICVDSFHISCNAFLCLHYYYLHLRILVTNISLLLFDHSRNVSEDLHQQHYLSRKRRRKKAYNILFAFINDKNILMYDRISKTCRIEQIECVWILNCQFG